jgi:zinc protease
MTSFVPRDRPELIVEGAQRAHVVEEPIIPGAEQEIAADPDFEHPRTPTKHDRSEPPLGPVPAVRLPEVWSATAANGMRVLGLEHSELPLVEFTLSLEGGQLLDPAGKNGTASLLADLLLEGTARRTPEELEDAIGELGADVTIEADREQIRIRARGLARNYAPLLALVREIVLEPRWDAQEFDRLKSALLTRVREREGDPQAVANLVFARVLYGEGHVFSMPVDGTLETVESITLDDLKDLYARGFSPSVAAFHLAGAVPREQVLASLGELEEAWRPAEVTLPGYAIREPAGRPAIYFIDVPGSKQSVILAGRLALSGTHEDFNDLVFANERLGAGSSARLFQLLRVEKGYTYGAFSGIPRRREVSPFFASTSVRANVTLESLELIREQIATYRATYTENDLETTKNILIKRATRDFETLDSLLGVLEQASALDLPPDYVERELAEVRGLTLAQVHATIDEYLDAGRMIWVVVGDGATQLERVAALGWGRPTVLDVHGAPAGVVLRAGG